MALTTAPDDRAWAPVIAEPFERLEERYPHLSELATQGHVRKSVLRLQKGIEQVRGEVARTKSRDRPRATPFVDSEGLIRP